VQKSDKPKASRTKGSKGKVNSKNVNVCEGVKLTILYIVLIQKIIAVTRRGKGNRFFSII
jgi:hypothetical protein